jgi:hypothetical protein
LYSQIAANKRRSVLVVVAFFVIWLAIGAVCGLIVRAASRPPHTWTPVLDGTGTAQAALGMTITTAAGYTIDSCCSSQEHPVTLVAPRPSTSMISPRRGAQPERPRALIQSPALGAAVNGLGSHVVEQGEHPGSGSRAQQVAACW